MADIKNIDQQEKQADQVLGEAATKQEEVADEAKKKADETLTDEKKKEAETSEVDMPTIDYKIKFQESQREALALKAKAEKLEIKVEELSRPKEISEQELKEKYPDWSEMSDREQRLVRENENNKLRLTNLEAQNSIYHNEKKWNAQIDKQVEEWDTFEQFPQIVERKEEFKQYCRKPSHKGANLEMLAKAFLFEVKDPPKKKASSAISPPQSKDTKAEEKKKWTAEEAKALRENQPSKYQQLVMSGAFDDLE